MTEYSASACYLECCFQKKQCLHSSDPVFKPVCGRERGGGKKCEAHPWAKLPPPREDAPHRFDWVGTAEKVPTKLDFKGTYENDVTVMCAVIVSNMYARLGLDPLDISPWASQRFAELTAARWQPAKEDVKNTMIRLGYMKKEAE